MPGDEPELLEPEDSLDASEQDETEEPIEPIEPGAFRLPAVPAGSRQLAPYDPLQLYIREISRFPMLVPEEEFELARLVRENKDDRAAFRLVSSHLRLVVRIAMDFQRRWMQNVLDLIQEGNVGLMRAVQKFDPEKGIKFSYYAAYWIKAYILKYIMDNWRMVKIGTTQAQRKLFYNLNKERQRLTAQGYDPSTRNLSESLNVSEADVLEMDQRLSGADLSLDMTMGEDSGVTRLDFIPALGPGIEDMLAQNEIVSHLEKHIQGIIPELNDKELELLEKRLLSDSPATLREIGDKYGITRERVRQIEARLLDKLRERLTDKIADFSPDWIRADE
ncbi:MAG: RNA polymerase factor sigma-32 [Desulfovibrionaceae bacterium]|nr:RNA polymerase factor sigma-32 [Desulfovibrionaceae bacterium]MBF0513550.1 RNA polymerase factor sigma-32 [Desulfovibrionaceae bacterium]